jgi:hypothetical protein
MIIIVVGTYMHVANAMHNYQLMARVMAIFFIQESTIREVHILKRDSTTYLVQTNNIEYLLFYCFQRI